MGLLKDVAELQKDTKSESDPSIAQVSRCIAPHLCGKVVQTGCDAVFARRVESADREGIWRQDSLICLEGGILPLDKGDPPLHFGLWVF